MQLVFAPVDLSMLVPVAIRALPIAMLIQLAVYAPTPELQMVAVVMADAIAMVIVFVILASQGKIQILQLIVSSVQRVILTIRHVWPARCQSLATTEVPVYQLGLVVAMLASLQLLQQLGAATATRVFRVTLPLLLPLPVRVVLDLRLALYSLAGA